MQPRTPDHGSSEGDANEEQRSVLRASAQSLDEGLVQRAGTSLVYGEGHFPVDHTRGYHGPTVSRAACASYLDLPNFNGRSLSVPTSINHSLVASIHSMHSWGNMP